MTTPADTLRAEVQRLHREHWTHVMRVCQDACARGGYCREAYLKGLDIQEAEQRSLVAAGLAGRMVA